MWNEATSDAPLYEALENTARRSPARFHMPGHKGHAHPLQAVLGDALRYDMTEIDGTDSLYDASGPILQAEKAAAKLFGARETLFSASGATLCIQAMFRLAQNTSESRTVICARNVHRSAVNAMALLGLDPVWVWPRPVEGCSLPGRIGAADVAKALEQAGGAAAVYVTSPDYYGVLSNIRAIAEVCRAHGAPLLVDNAHGSHLRFCGEGELHPLRNGASLVCDSAHKTLPVLTGGAFLHISSSVFTREAGKQAMSLFGTTSPSYLIMLSLDLARAWLGAEGRAAFAALCRQVEELNKLAAEKGIGLTMDGPLRDPTRLVLETARAGVRGDEAARMMQQKGIIPEFADDRRVVLLPAPFNTKQEYDALRAFIEAFPAGNSIMPDAGETLHPKKAMELRKAITARSIDVPVEQAAGRVCAECRCPCPPGIPVVMPGEYVSAGLVENLKSYGVFNLKVVE